MDREQFYEAVMNANARLNGLLWCFACLSVEEGEEPCVTFDESDATIGFLEAVQRELAGTEAEDNEAMGGGGGDPSAVGLAMYRSVGRAAVADALAATQAMVADSAPLPPEHRRVHTSSRVLDAAECRRVIESSEAHAALQAMAAARCACPVLTLCAEGGSHAAQHSQVQWWQ